MLSRHRIMSGTVEQQRPDRNLQPRIRQCELAVVIEIPKGSFIKRGVYGKIDFISPFPCPFNYGSIHEYIGGEGDLLDAVVLGQRLARGQRVVARAYGAVGLTDHGLYDDKLICSQRPLTAWQRRWVLIFFKFYALCKRILNAYRGCSGPTYCQGWGDADSALERAHPIVKRI